jgi:hypothetical protein
MLVPQDVSLYLNNALRPTHQMAELDAEAALPHVIRDMPDQVSGHFVELDPSLKNEMTSAWKRVMILNDTQVLYTFTFDPATESFRAMKR